MKIAVAGIGYVGLSLATLFSQKYEVVALDILPEKVKQVNRRISPIQDDYIEKFFKEKELNLKATLDYKKALKGADFVIICTPTNYYNKKHFFDTSLVENIIKKTIEVCGPDKATIVIKSTVPIGFTESMKKKYHLENILFSPEFLREKRALYDNLYPSRIIVGEKTEKAKKFAELLKSCALKKNINVIYMGSSEAEAAKLFANTYLAMRVAYFNELDTYAETKKLNTEEIIKGVCADPRIGDYYNNPSFGYGGYCLPKDAKQLSASYQGIPQDIIKATIKANNARKAHIASVILAKKPKTIGIYRLAMKTDSDNFKSSAIQGVMERLRAKGMKIQVYEPILTNKHTFNGCRIETDLDKFKQTSDIIVANRLSVEIEDVIDKVYTRDIFRDN